MATDCYFGTYARFDTASKENGAMLMGADNLVGDAYDVVFRTDDGVSQAWMVNRFGGDVGYFDPSFSRKLSVMAARGWRLQARLSFVAYSDSPDPGCYWGQAAVMCFDPAHEQAFETFSAAVGARLEDGTRPDVDLGKQGVAAVIERGGEWSPSKTVPLPKLDKGTVLMKSRRKLSEKMIEQGRKGNKGCYVVSWAFILLVVALVAWGIVAIVGA